MFDIVDVCVTPAPAPYTVLFLDIPVFPIIILFFRFLGIKGRLLNELRPRQLSGGSIGRAMLDCGVPVAKVTEIVKICRTKEGTGRKGMDWSISPLHE